MVIMSSDGEPTIQIATLVSGVACDFLNLAEALDGHEDYATQITTIEIKDELTRFKVCYETI
jgi:hypothetical protein